jgi:hypothetical protein
MSVASAYLRTSLLTILFMTFHYADDVLRKSSGMDKPGFSALMAVLILVIWLYGILMLRERRSGYIIGLLGSLMASFIAVGHLTGIVGDVFIGEIADATGAFFVWAVIGLGVTAFTSLIFSAYGLFFPGKEKPAASRK